MSEPLFRSLCENECFKRYGFSKEDMEKLYNNGNRIRVKERRKKSSCLNITLRRPNGSKTICDGCHKEYRLRHIVYFKGKNLCKWCRAKKTTSKSMLSACSIGRGFSLKKALNRSYYVHPHKNRGAGQLNIPSVLVGKTVKLIVVDEE